MICFIFRWNHLIADSLELFLSFLWQSRSTCWRGSAMKLMMHGELPQPRAQFACVTINTAWLTQPSNWSPWCALASILHPYRLFLTKLPTALSTQKTLYLSSVPNLLMASHQTLNKIQSHYQHAPWPYIHDLVSPNCLKSFHTSSPSLFPYSRYAVLLEFLKYD